LNSSVAVGLAYRGAQPAWLATAQPTWAFWPEAKSSGALSPIGTGGLPAKSDQAVVVGAVVEEQAPAMGALLGFRRRWEAHQGGQRQ
jgi:hypothetical protein